MLVSPEVFQKYRFIKYVRIGKINTLNDFLFIEFFDSTGDTG